MCLCVCVCLSMRICAEPHARSLPHCFVHVAYGHGSVLLQHCCDMLYTYSYVDGIIFFYSVPYNGTNLAKTDRFRKGWDCILRVKSDIYDCFIRRLLYLDNISVVFDN